MDYFFCENDKCKHFIDYKMKYTTAVKSNFKGQIICSYCKEEMKYSYSDIINDNNNYTIYNEKRKLGTFKK